MKRIAMLAIAFLVIGWTYGQESQLLESTNLSKDMLSGKDLSTLGGASGMTAEEGYMWVYDNSRNNCAFVVFFSENNDFTWAKFDYGANDFTDAALGTWKMKGDEIKISPDKDAPSPYTSDTYSLARDKGSFTTSSGEQYYKMKLE
jgi:hypothetical protein